MKTFFYSWLVNCRVVWTGIFAFMIGSLLFCQCFVPTPFDNYQQVRFVVLDSVAGMSLPNSVVEIWDGNDVTQSNDTDEEGSVTYYLEEKPYTVLASKEGQASSKIQEFVPLRFGDTYPLICPRIEMKTYPTIPPTIESLEYSQDKLTWYPLTSNSNVYRDDLSYLRVVATGHAGIYNHGYIYHGGITIHVDRHGLSRDMPQITYETVRESIPQGETYLSEMIFNLSAFPLSRGIHFISTVVYDAAGNRTQMDVYNIEVQTTLDNSAIRDLPTPRLDTITFHTYAQSMELFSQRIGGEIKGMEYLNPTIHSSLQVFIDHTSGDEMFDLGVEIYRADGTSSFKKIGFQSIGTVSESTYITYHDYDGRLKLNETYHYKVRLTRGNTVSDYSASGEGSFLPPFTLQLESPGYGAVINTLRPDFCSSVINPAILEDPTIKSLNVVFTIGTMTFQYYRPLYFIYNLQENQAYNYSLEGGEEVLTPTSLFRRSGNQFCYSFHHDFLFPGQTYEWNYSGGVEFSHGMERQAYCIREETNSDHVTVRSLSYSSNQKMQGSINGAFLVTISEDTQGYE